MNITICTPICTMDPSVDESQVLRGECGPEEGESRPEAARGGPREHAFGGDVAPLVPVQEVLQRPVAAVVPIPRKHTYKFFTR